MRLGVVFPQLEIGPAPRGVRDFVEAVENEGYNHLSIYDHVIGADVSTRPDWRGPYTSDSLFHEVMVLYGFLAAFTTRLQLVTSILILPQRQTVLVAKQAAEIDVLSEGRLRLGVGLGWNEVEYQALNEDFSNRGRRMEEQIDVMRRLWTEPVITFHGQWHHIEAAGINPLPVQRPIPVWIGASSDRAIRRAARLGDGWFPQVRPDASGREVVKQFRQYVTEAGRDPSQVGIEARISYGDGNPDRWKRELEGWRELNAQYVSLVTMSAGLDSVSRHIDATERFLEVARAFAD
jgi:probable F420-dependent oxidoreductase